MLKINLKMTLFAVLVFILLVACENRENKIYFNQPVTIDRKSLVDLQYIEHTPCDKTLYLCANG